MSSSDKLRATSNKYIFISSYTITQERLFDAVRKATPGEEWIVEHVDSKAAASEGRDKLAKGDFHGIFDLLKYVVFAEGSGDLGDFSRVVSNELLGLEEEDLDADVKTIVEGIKSA